MHPTVTLKNVSEMHNTNVNPNVNHGLTVIMMLQCRFTDAQEMGRSGGILIVDKVCVCVYGGVGMGTPNFLLSLL